jgi:DNA polymerase-1
MDKVTLIDCDSLLYKGIEDLEEYKDRIDDILSTIIHDTKSTHYKAFLESKGNNTFRKIVNRLYKANRVSKDLPANFIEIKDYVIETYNPFLSVGVETDDSIVSTLKYIQQVYPLTDIVIAANDKDYLTVPVTYYDLYHGRIGDIKVVSKEEADYNFYKQLLMGDSVDNVKGIKGIGPKGASKVLDNSTNHFLSVCREYKNTYKGKWKDQIRLNYLMLKLRDDARPCKDFEKVEFN